MAERRQRWALLLSVALHALALAWLAGWTPRLAPPPAPETVTYMVDLPPPDMEASPPPAAPQAQAPTPSSKRTREAPAEPAPSAPDTSPVKPRASRDAPAPPSAEDWAMASTYTLKNGKRYRYNWGLQLRSLMGTAVEGENNGVVRFRVTIAPDGTLALLETLWATSAATERLARQAMERMPPLPPTPGGAPRTPNQALGLARYGAHTALRPQGLQQPSRSARCSRSRACRVLSGLPFTSLGRWAPNSAGRSM